MCGEGTGRMRRDTYCEAGRGDLDLGSLRLAAQTGQAVTGPFLVDRSIVLRASLPHSLLIQRLCRASLMAALKLVALRLLFLCDLDHQP